MKPSRIESETIAAVFATALALLLGVLLMAQSGCSLPVQRCSNATNAAPKAIGVESALQVARQSWRTDISVGACYGSALHV